MYMCGSHGFSSHVCTMHWYSKVTCFLTFWWFEWPFLSHYIFNVFDFLYITHPHTHTHTHTHAPICIHLSNKTSTYRHMQLHMHMHTCNTHVHMHTHTQGACIFVAAWLHYFFLSSFSWMLCEGIMLYLMLVVVFSKLSKKWWFFMIIGYGEFATTTVCSP